MKKPRHLNTVPNTELDVVLDEVLAALMGPVQTAASQHAMASRMCQALGLEHGLPRAA